MDDDEYIRKEKRRQQKANWAQRRREALRIVSVLDEVRGRPHCVDVPGNIAPGPSNPEDCPPGPSNLVNDVSSPVNPDCDGTSSEERVCDQVVHVEDDEETVTDGELFERQLHEIFVDYSPGPANRSFNAPETGSPDGNAHNYKSTSDEDGDNEEGDDNVMLQGIWRILLTKMMKKH